MQLISLSGLLLIAAWGVAVGGCTTSSGPAPQSQAAASRKGRWVTLPPAVGSHIPQRIWVEESGTNAPAGASVSRVQSYGPGALERVQRGGAPGQESGSR